MSKRIDGDEKRFRESVGKTIRQIRESMEMGIYEISRETGIHKSTISRMERGIAGLDMYSVFRILCVMDKALMISPDGMILEVNSDAKKVGMGQR